jgi:hypothetical protein
MDVVGNPRDESHAPAPRPTRTCPGRELLHPTGWVAKQRSVTLTSAHDNVRGRGTAMDVARHSKYDDIEGHTPHPTVSRRRRSSAFSRPTSVVTNSRRRRIVFTAVLSALLAFLLWSFGLLPTGGVKHLVTPDVGLPPHIYENLAMYAPWFPVDQYVQPPRGCVVDQVNIVSCLCSHPSNRQLNRMH